MGSGRAEPAEGDLSSGCVPKLNGLAAQLASARTLEQLHLVRRRLLAFRRLYIAVETTLDFYGDAVNTRDEPQARLDSPRHSI